ncbi:MAG: ribonuclease HII [Rhodospirillales bacterium]
MPDLELELAALADRHTVICGVDEAGRGPWAGPVVAAAVVLGSLTDDPVVIAMLDDSKKLSAKRREELFGIISSAASVGVGVVEAGEIDRVNILEATFRAMRRAVTALNPLPDFALVDGNRCPTLPCASQSVIRGDSVSASIAAASIIAKVTRDRIMADLAAAYPGYGWERNAGYGTAEHSAALAKLGVTPYHRTSFKPVRSIVEQGSATSIS